MEDLMNILKNQLSQQAIEQFSQQLGGVDKEKTAKATTGIATALITALAKNAQKPEQAKSLASALERDHDGSILDDITGFLSGQREPQNQKMLNGEGILQHVLGNKQSGMIEMVARMSGLDRSKTSKLMTMLAPVIMGILGKQKQENNLDESGLASLLQSTLQTQQGKSKQLDLISTFLDRDNDGSVVDDVAEIGVGFLGRLFKRRKR